MRCLNCLNCGHHNAAENQFCGMCGNLLRIPAAEPELVIASVLELLELESEPPASSRGEPAAEPELVIPRVLELLKESDPPASSRYMSIPRGAHQPRPAVISERVVAAAAPEDARSDDKSPVEQPTVVLPPVAKLSTPALHTQSECSYLFRDESERSHIGLPVFVIIVLALGGVLYAKWQPIRDHALMMMASTHSRSNSLAKQDSKSMAATTPGSMAPTTGVTTRNSPSRVTAHAEIAAPKEASANHDPLAIKEGPENDGNRRNASARKAGAATRGRANQGGGSELVASGEQYVYGRGATRNCDRAVSFFNAAAAKQNAQAFSHLGALYATGNCVAMDRVAAYGWFRRAYAAEPSNHYFEQNISILWREMSPDERQRASR